MDENLTEAIRQEKIVLPANQQDVGWNNAIDYILAMYIKPLFSPIPNNQPSNVCNICFDDGIGSEKWGGHNPGCPRARE